MKNKLKRTTYENICVNCCKKAFGTELRGAPGFLAHALPPDWYTTYVGTHRGTVCSEACAKAWGEFHLDLDRPSRAAAP